MNFTVLHKQSLKQYNSLGLEAEADTVVFPHNQESVGAVFHAYPKAKMVILGKGTNILLSKKYYDPSYVFINLKLLDYVELRTGNLIVAESGVTLSRLSWTALESNIAGFEFLEDIPGTVGGGLIMNAGTYRNNIGDLVRRIRSYNPSLDRIEDREFDCSDFTRRSSNLAEEGKIVLECTFGGFPGDYLDSLNKLLEIKRDRYEKQPRNFPNAGSVFKRPIVNDQESLVWKLVNDVGLRGTTRNGAMISEKHTGFIINRGGATYDDMIYLIDLCRERVKKQFGIELELEWKIV